jgi:hypothetical protein
VQRGRVHVENRPLAFRHKKAWQEIGGYEFPVVVSQPARAGQRMGAHPVGLSICKERT